jgi:hypothetical protein
MSQTWTLPLGGTTTVRITLSGGSQPAEYALRMLNNASEQLQTGASFDSIANADRAAALLPSPSDGRVHQVGLGDPHDLVNGPVPVGHWRMALACVGTGSVTVTVSVKPVDERLPSPLPYSQIVECLEAGHVNMSDVKVTVESTITLKGEAKPATNYSAGWAYRLEPL